MELRVKPEVAFLQEREIEAIANSLLDRFEETGKKVVQPPVPIETIAEDFLGFELIADYLPAETLAYVDPNRRVICTNLARSDYFDHVGTELTIAHEVGHLELGHFEEAGIQLALGLLDEPNVFLHREHQPNKYKRHELQAEYFAGCLMMPKRLIISESQQYDLRYWPSIYTLANRFTVSPSAMTRRLKVMKLIYVKDKTLYLSKEDAHGQGRLL